jgi:DNA-binding IclR family transcriptional regulator
MKNLARQKGTQSIDRAVEMLRLVAGRASEGIRLGELVVQSGLNRPTARRILIALIRKGLIEQNARSRSYFLGPETYALGILAASRFGIHRIALPGLMRLAEQTSDTAFLLVRRGDFSVCLGREEGAFPIRAQILSPGDRHPLGVGAGGLAILSTLPEDEVENHIKEFGSEIAARYPRLTPDVLRELVAEARVQGVAFNRGLTFHGSWGMGVPIRSVQREVIAALSISAIEHRLDQDRQASIVKLLQKEARLLEEKLGSVVEPI